MSSIALPLELGDLAQAAAAFEEGQASASVCFEFSVCVAPTNCNYLVFAGLAPLLEQLQQFRLDASFIEYLRYHPSFAGISLRWFDHLSQLHFTGDVWSMAEGGVFFAPAPVLRITSPFDVGLLASSMVIGILTHQIQVATKVSRLLSASEGRQLYEMGLRRTPNIEQACATTRAAYIAGIISTTNAEAARRWQLPTQTLMSHAWPMFFPDEVEAFHRYGKHLMTTSNPVVDTNDSLAGVKLAIASGSPMQAIRLDSGDLNLLSTEARKLLDQNGRRHVKIIASGQLDEEKVAKLVSQRAPIDGFAIGSAIAEPTSLYINSVYKLVAMQERSGCWEPACKMTLGKRSYPWPKQVFRTASDDGSFSQDVIAWDRESLVGEKQLHQVMKQGELISKLPGIEACRDYSMMQRIRLPAELLSLAPVKQRYPIRYSATLEQELVKLKRLRSIH